MNVDIFQSPASLGEAAAAKARQLIIDALSEKQKVSVILATGASQFEVLAHLTEFPDIDWSRIDVFHLDEYIGITEKHPASFRKYLRERFEQKVNALGSFEYIQGDTDDPSQECKRINEIIGRHQIAVALIGIGENGHLAFNDPPADFEATDPFMVVELDEGCRRQQLGEGWFDSLDEVPRRAISMSIPQIMKSKHLIVSVPDSRKADAVKCALEGPVTPLCPASKLQEHKSCYLFLDRNSASKLTS